MSANEKDPSKTPATIKIAAKDASLRATEGGADPGPGDPSAEPSMMPEPVNVPRPPTDSELVVKSVKTSNSRQIKTINDPVSLPKSRKSSASTRLSGRGGGGVGGGSGSAPVSEITSAKAINKTNSGEGASGAKTGGGASGASGPKSGGGPGPQSAGGSGGALRATFEGSEKGVSVSAGHGAVSSGMASVKTAKTASGATSGPASMPAADNQSGASGGQEHDEEEEGEGEVETQPSPSPGKPAAGPSGADSSAPVSPDAEGGVDSAPASSGGGASKMSPKTSAMSKRSTTKKTSSASSASSGASGHQHGHDKKKKKKLTKFRYHKRITVRTHGKTSPSTIMHKVNKKDHKAGITPSTIEDMDTEELMRRAGIKGNKQTHWRVRLRQTKRVTTGGKTVTQTKIAYRDSEGNKRVKTSLSPYCKKCGKKLEECKCDEK